MSGRQPVAGFRTSHGQAAAHGRLTASECPPCAELLPPTGSDLATDQPDRDSAGRFTAGNAVSRRPKHRPGRNGALAKLHAKADPSWRAAQKWGQRYLSHRMAELATLHGGTVSAGVGSVLATAADCLADARWLRAKGAAEGAPDLIKLAAQLGTQARGAERDAWQLAALEAQARPRLTAQERNAADLARIVAANAKAAE